MHHKTARKERHGEGIRLKGARLQTDCSQMDFKSVFFSIIVILNVKLEYTLLQIAQTAAAIDIST